MIWEIFLGDRNLGIHIAHLLRHKEIRVQIFFLVLIYLSNKNQPSLGLWFERSTVTRTIRDNEIQGHSWYNF